MRSGILETPRLLVEPFGPEHLTDRYVGWLNDPAVTRFSQQRHHAHTMESCRAYLASFEGRPHYFWAVVGRDRAVGHVGNMTAYADEASNVADVGILLGERRLWGQGYGGEAWLAVCDYLFRIAGFRKVTAGAIAPNVGMCRVMDRAGMAADGTRARHAVWEGGEVDVVHRALFRDDWMARYPIGPFASGSERRL